MSWFGALVTDQVRGVVDEVGGRSPRAGLLAALVLGIHRTYGRSANGRRIRALALVAEACTEVLFGGDPMPFLLRASRADLKGLERRFAVPPLPRWCDESVPEAVLTMAVLAVVTCEVAEVPEEEREPIRAALEWLGYRMEGCPDVPERWMDDRPRPRPIGLPPSDFAEQFETLEPEPEAGRRFEAWAPHEVPQLERTTGEVEEAMRSVVPPQGTLGRAAAYLQDQGGKRLRARLCRAAGGAARDAALVEWVHLASLAVDDVMDEATLRRGCEPLHQLTDVPFALSVAAWIAWGCLARENRVLPSTMERMARGQLREWELGRHATPEQVDWIAERKTAALFELALALPGGDPRFGRYLGLAFQAVDDQLDVLGDPQQLGKPIGVDARMERSTTATRSVHASRKRAAHWRTQAAACTRDPALLSLLAEAVERDR